MFYEEVGQQQQQQYQDEGRIYEPINQSVANYWTQIAEVTMPLKQSKMASANRGYSSLNNSVCGHGPGGQGDGRNSSNNGRFQASLDMTARHISRKLIVVNGISLLINLALAIFAFYFAFVNNSSATSAFAADCVLDFISSAIVLWRYCGDSLTSIYRHAREQIACIYLGALFEISALAIIVKASSDMLSSEGPQLDEGAAGYDLVYLAVIATIACCVLTVFKCALFNTIRDNSILLDVINTVISTVFAVSIIMSQALINIDPSFWYLDPVISIVLALFMAAFGIKVIHQNFSVLRPVYRSSSNSSLLHSFSSTKGDANFNHKNKPPCLSDQTIFMPPLNHINSDNHHFGANLNTSIEYSRATNGRQNNWQKSDYSTIAFV